MEIWPIDFDKSLEEIAEWHKQWKVERYGSDSLNPSRYYNDDGRYLFGVREGDNINDEKTKSDRVLEILCRLRLINQRLKGTGLSQHIQWQEREHLKTERETLYREFLDMVQVIPDALASDTAKMYFSRAIEFGLMDENYKWLKGLQMLSCFAREMSIKLNLGKGERISWKPFEILFKIEKGRLRLNYNDIQKTGQQPKESNLIDSVFE